MMEAERAPKKMERTSEPFSPDLKADGRRSTG